jgi:ATP-binding cassette subfamily B protein RaxB
VVLEIVTTERWRRATVPLKKVSVLDLARPMSRWRADIVTILGLSALLEFLVLVLPLQMQLSIDNAVQATDGRLVWVLGAAFGLGALLFGSISIVRAWALTVFGTRVGFDLRQRFVHSLHSKSATFFTKHHTGDILNRSRSVDTIQTMVTAQLLQALLDAFMSTAMIVVMIAAVPVLGLVMVMFGVINVGVTSGLKQVAIQNSRRHLRAVAKADAIFLENARAGRAIRLFGKESVRISVWKNKFVEVTNLALENARILMYSAQVAQTAGALSNAVLIAMGTYLVIQERITLGTMMMFAIFQSIFVVRLNNCITYLMELRQVQTHAERIDEVLAEEEEYVTGKAEIQPFRVAPDEPLRIEVKDLWFRYGNDAPWILQGVDLVVEPGEALAITGPSGCGKSTLMGIMLGLLTPTQGKVLVNGRDLASISSTDYARLIGVVMQDDILFHGTVADNLAFFDAPVDMDKVKQATRKANIADEIEAMPMGYYSILAEAAADISGGQRQRLFIARAIYHEPRILFLDEATSHLDGKSERQVSDAIRSMHMTRVLIAHRKETIASATRVLVLDPATGGLRPAEGSAS